MASSDFSWLALFLAGLVTVAQAYTQPTTGPAGNAIHTPGLDQQVPAGKPFDITWDPTTDGTVTLLFLHGPANNVQPLYPIVEKIPNTGKYTWTPKTDIAPESTHYAIQIIADSNGQFQWSTQFGISNPTYSGSHSGSGSSSSSSVSIHVSASTSSSTSASASESATTSASSLPGTVRPTLTASTGFPMNNSSSVHPSGTISTSATVKTTATVKPTTISTSALPTTTDSAATTSSTSEVSTVSEAMAAMYTAAGGVVAFAAAAALAL